jgi:ABC-type sugar transport system, periplasmic component
MNLNSRRLPVARKIVRCASRHRPYGVRARARRRPACRRPHHQDRHQPVLREDETGRRSSRSKDGAKLLTAAGKFDGDNASQVTAIENMMTAGAKAILITPSDTKAIVPSIKKARAAGVMVVALDTPTDPQDATDALFATDNFKAGVLIGKYAKAAMNGKPAKIATLDLAPGVSVGVLRHNGFLEGFGVKEGDPSIVCSQDTRGDQAKGQTAMENCLQKSPDINVVYTINEPAAAGAYRALKRRQGQERDDRFHRRRL